MVHKYKKIYQTQDETISKNCVEWEGFTYLPPSGICVDDHATLNFNYIDCGGTPQTISYEVICSAGIYELLLPLCVKDGSVVQINGASVQSILYGVSC